MHVWFAAVALVAAVAYEVTRNDARTFRYRYGSLLQVHDYCVDAVVATQATTRTHR